MLNNLIILLTGVICFWQIPIMAQDTEKHWYSEESNICMSIKKDSAQINNIERLVIKEKGDKLKVIWYNNQTLLGWQKEVYYYQILSTSQDSLIIARLPTKLPFEIIPDSITRFVSTPQGCKSLWRVSSVKSN